jgi:2-polyprenyl-3-methyl-5-hydroxy-6-metoxy-1,4-benzoquinol methylase
MAENVVDNYGWTTDRGPQSCGYIAPEVLRVLKKLGARRVLDLGAGNGVLCGHLVAQGHQAVGVEYDKQGVDLARASYPHIAFYNFGVQDDPMLLLEKEAAFDAVVSTEVIEHLFSPHLLPLYASGVLKPGGYLVLTTPYHGYFKNLALALLNKWDKHFTVLWHGGHIKFWSRATLTALLEQQGYAVVGFSGVGRIPYVWKSMVVVAKRVRDASPA